jgi:hypothetical protein
MHCLLGSNDQGGEIMSMKKKRSPQKSAGDTTAVPLQGQKTAKKTGAVPGKSPRPALDGIGRSFSILLDRTRIWLKPAEKADS